MTEDNRDGREQSASRGPGAGSFWARLWSKLGAAPGPPAVHRLYATLVAHARAPLYYRDLGVPDTPEGRFEVLALHVALAVRRLSKDGEAGRSLAQALFDLMVADLDVNLRELGVGDLSVGKQVKRLARQFYARLAVITDAFDHEAPERLRPMLATNLYHGGNRPPAESPDRLIRILGGIARALDDQTPAELQAGRIDLPGDAALLAFCHNR